MPSSGTVVDRGLEGVVVGTTALSGVEGAAGRLTFRGYDIHDVASHATYEEVCYLLLFGRLPTVAELADFTVRLAANRALPPALLHLMPTVPREARPMDVLRTFVSALELFTVEPDGERAPSSRTAISLIAKTPTIVAAWDRLRRGLEPIAPAPQLSTAANFLYMQSGRAPIEEAERALDTYLVLLADHSYNASTFAARVTASTRADMFAAATSAIATLGGDLHGGAPAKVMAMLLELESPQRAEAYVRDLLARGERVMGIGHREYKVRDPRAEHLEAMARTLGEASNPKWYLLARALEDACDRVLGEAKPGRRLFANVEFYTAPTLYSLGIPPDTFPSLFACSRMAGWTAHILEQHAYNRLIRPQATYSGPGSMPWMPVTRRPSGQRTPSIGDSRA
jgi:citrate synthase